MLGRDRRSGTVRSSGVPVSGNMGARRPIFIGWMPEYPFDTADSSRHFH